MRSLRQEYWNGLPFSSQGHLPDPGIEPMSPALQADSLLLSYYYNVLIYLFIRKTPNIITGQY